MDRVLERVSRLRKPVVVCFLGARPEPIARSGALAALTLEDSAVQVVALADQRPVDEVRAALQGGNAVSTDLIRNEAARLRGTHRFVRGLYCGGTLANEAALVLLHMVGAVSGNLTLPGVQQLPDPSNSRGHTIVDLGDEVFTSGQPHPMIEPVIREQRLLAEAHDPSTSVILMDFVLGYGSHPDPVGASVPALRQARNFAAEQGRGLAIVASVCGTDRDPQGRACQIEKLRTEAVIVAQSNAAGAQIAAVLVGGGEYNGPVAIPSSTGGHKRPTDIESVRTPAPLSSVRVVNIGVLDFAEALWAQGVGCVHVDWTPPSNEELELEDVMDRLL
jgi:hypothetical protein